ncbi:MAG TPA: hypothetical protein VKT81_05475 [Bryobacteraceae bacterium]|nr:hypothetical protein [Bryobacteraceae bacterium]
MMERTNELVFSIGVPLSSPSLEEGRDICTLLSEVGDLLNEYGWRMDCRAKFASGRIYHWAGIVDFSGREMASSGGWFSSEYDAVRRAIATLEVMDVPSH